jgi:ribosomal protein S18 acetylase RimI-like enzyme
MSKLVFRAAVSSDAADITTLVNRAYRGEASRQGWTTEADLLDGRRTTETDVVQMINTPDAAMLLCERDHQLIGSIHLERVDDHVHLGMFVVDPVLQSRGIGKQLLAEAEQQARQRWHVAKAVMHVIACRQELIAFYERRGYARTGQFQPFPENPAVWAPKVERLQLEVLEKSI